MDTSAFTFTLLSFPPKTKLIQSEVWILSMHADIMSQMATLATSFKQCC